MNGSHHIAPLRRPRECKRGDGQVPSAGPMTRDKAGRGASRGASPPRLGGGRVPGCASQRRLGRAGGVPVAVYRESGRHWASLSSAGQRSLGGVSGRGYVGELMSPTKSAFNLPCRLPLIGRQSPQTHSARWPPSPMPLSMTSIAVLSSLGSHRPCTPRGHSPRHHSNSPNNIIVVVVASINLC